jgi:hypothetical protein
MITHLIPAFRGLNTDHVPNLRATVASYRPEVEGAECLVVEPRGEPLLEDYGFCRRVELATENPFPQCELSNYGQKVAANELHSTRGADTPFTRGWERAAVEFDAEHGHPFFCGFDKILLMDEESSRRLRAALEAGADWAPRLTGRWGGPGWSKGAGTNFCIRREAYERVGPRAVYDVHMPDDVDYAYRCAVLYGVTPQAYVLPQPAYHLWHPEADRKTSSARKIECRAVHRMRMEGYRAAIERARAGQDGGR